MVNVNLVEANSIDLEKAYEVVKANGPANFMLYVNKMVYRSALTPKSTFHMTDRKAPSTAITLRQLLAGKFTVKQETSAVPEMEAAAIEVAKVFIDSGKFEDVKVKVNGVTISEVKAEVKTSQVQEPAEEPATEEKPAPKRRRRRKAPAKTEATEE